MILIIIIKINNNSYYFMYTHITTNCSYLYQILSSGYFSLLFIIYL